MRFMSLLELFLDPPPPIKLSWSRIIVLGEATRGQVLLELDKVYHLVVNRNLVSCGAALPEKISETINIPDTCMNTYQWALANVDKAFWDIGVPLLCVGALGVGFLCLKRCMDYADNVGTITIDQDRFQEGLRQLAQNNDGTKMESPSKRLGPSYDVSGRKINEETGRGALGISPKFSASRFDESGGLLDPNGYPITGAGYLDMNRVQRDKDGNLPSWLANFNPNELEPFDANNHYRDPDVWGNPTPPPLPPSDDLTGSAFEDFLKNLPDTDEPEPES